MKETDKLTDKENEPAFPCILERKDPFGKLEGHSHAFGMTLRDYFASCALAGELASCTGEAFYKAKDVAKRVYEIADAMLKEREKK